MNSWLGCWVKGFVVLLSGHQPGGAPKAVNALALVPLGKGLGNHEAFLQVWISAVQSAAVALLGSLRCMPVGESERLISQAGWNRCNLLVLMAPHAFAACAAQPESALKTLCTPNSTNTSRCRSACSRAACGSYSVQQTLSSVG